MESIEQPKMLPQEEVYIRIPKSAHFKDET